jgi:hypothetical protein
MDRVINKFCIVQLRTRKTGLDRTGANYNKAPSLVAVIIAGAPG